MSMSLYFIFGLFCWGIFSICCFCFVFILICTLRCLCVCLFFVFLPQWHLEDRQEATHLINLMCSGISSGPAPLIKMSKKSARPTVSSCTSPWLVTVAVRREWWSSANSYTANTDVTKFTGVKIKYTFYYTAHKNIRLVSRLSFMM